MKEIDKLSLALQNQNAVEEQFKHNVAFNILFINPSLTGSGLYKHILPALSLKKVGMIETAFTSIEKFNPTKQFREYKDVHLDTNQIRWPETISFPFTTEPIKPFIDQVRKLAKPIIIYHIDFNFLDLPQAHPYKEIFKKQAVDSIFENIAAADRVVFSNNRLAEIIIAEAKRRAIPASSDKYRIMILLVNEAIQLADIYPRQEKKEDYLHLCILVGDTQMNDLADAAKILKASQSFHKEKLKLTVFGCSKANCESVLGASGSGIFYEHEPPVPLPKYYIKLSAISPDIVLIPNDKSTYSITSHSYKRFLDCALLNIPVITPNVFPYMDIIISGSNGFLYDDGSRPAKPKEAKPPEPPPINTSNIEEIINLNLGRSDQATAESASIVSFHEIISSLIKNKVVLANMGANVNGFVKEFFSYDNKKNVQDLIDMLG